MINKINTKEIVIGLGSGNAYPFITPSLYLDKYTIVSLFNKLDTGLIKRRVKTFTLQDYLPNVSVSRVNQKELLKIPEARKYILNQGSPLIFVRKTTPGIEAFCEEYNFKILGNPRKIRDQFENKLFFRNSLENLNIKPINGEVILFESLTWEKTKTLIEKYGTDKKGERTIVFQVAELTHGGGVGTQFVANLGDYENFINRMTSIKNGVLNRKVENVIVTSFVTGTQASILSCVTKHGVITGSIQTQLQDIPDVLNMKKGSGLYCGHDWSYKKFSDDIVSQAVYVAKTYGDFMATKGYKGIFGLDLIIDDNKVYPIECNPRYTDALPVSSFLALSNNIPTLEYYHLLEHLGEDYDVDVEKISAMYKRNFNGSQIILSIKDDNWVKNSGELKAGVYKYTNGEIAFKQDSFDLRDIENENEFMLTDGVPLKNTKFKPKARIMRVVFKRSILKSQGELYPEIKELISKIYGELSFVQIKSPNL